MPRFALLTISSSVPATTVHRLWISTSRSDRRSIRIVDASVLLSISPIQKQEPAVTVVEMVC